MDLWGVLNSYWLASSFIQQHLSDLYITKTFILSLVNMFHFHILTEFCSKDRIGNRFYWVPIVVESCVETFFIQLNEVINIFILKKGKVWWKHFLKSHSKWKRQDSNTSLCNLTNPCSFLTCPASLLLNIFMTVYHFSVCLRCFFTYWLIIFEKKWLSLHLLIPSFHKELLGVYYVLYTVTDAWNTKWTSLFHHGDISNSSWPNSDFSDSISTCLNLSS